MSFGAGRTNQMNGGRNDMGARLGNLTRQLTEAQNRNNESFIQATGQQPIDPRLARAAQGLFGGDSFAGGGSVSRPNTSGMYLKKAGQSLKQSPFQPMPASLNARSNQII